MKLFRKTDAIAVLAVLAVAAGGWALARAGAGSGSAQAEIYLGGERKLALPLGAGEERVFSLPERPQVLLRLEADGSIRFLESDCPDKICIHTGKLLTPGQSAACLPNGVLVKITAPDPGGNGVPGVIAG